MASNSVNYQSLQCTDLKNILKSKGIPFSNRNKQDLVDLCEGAEALNLPHIGHYDGDIQASISRRTVRGKTYPHPYHDGSIAWTPNLAIIPSIDAFDVSSFLQNYCGWSEERLRNRKSDSGYKLHCSGHIYDVVMALLGDDMCFIKGKCVPETRQSSDPYIPWILVEKSGHIFSAECTCVAGDGSCKHVVALLFGIIDHVTSIEDRSTIGVTDTAAYWNKPRKVCRPVAVHDLDIRIDTNEPDRPRPSEDSGYLPLKSSALDLKSLEKNIVQVLKKSNTLAVALYTLSDSDDDNDVSMGIEDTPKNIIDLMSMHGQENLKVDDSYVKKVNEFTKGQSINLMWQYQRKGRLTASNFFNAFHYRGDKADNYIVRSIMGQYHFTSKSVEYGKRNESVARERYVDHMTSCHPSFKCAETGIYVYKDFPFFAASPDGISECKCCGKGLVEIKCPYSSRNETSQVAMSKNSSCAIVNGNYELKKSLSSPFYVQMLGQMAVCKFSHCDFVLFTQKDIYVERIHFSKADWELLSEKLKSFYMQYVLPNLV
ncbi:uncharacterized protein LOC133199124 [Saccostrea echinata]|uniref:uncharacterized protein LOC133199124 n=1 Tax=Saccostrea echinata TaxID=191078 RepID=UPI002A802922|nr:uncharacterized protein LOC133199124 [Saccostrea echinata]